MAQNSRDKLGRTALMRAETEGQTLILLTLRAKGADPNLRDNAGKTVLMIAAANGATDVAQALIDKRGRECQRYDRQDSVDARAQQGSKLDRCLAQESRSEGVVAKLEMLHLMNQHWRSTASMRHSIP